MQSQLTIEDLEAENLQLRAQIAELEQHLRAATERINRGFQTSPLATIEFDTAGVIHRWNPAAERIFGWSADEAIGRELLPLVVPPEAMDHVQDVLQTLVSGTVTNSRNANVTRDGRTIICQWYNTILKDETGAVTGLLSQTEDVTAAMQHEDDLRTFQALVENAPDGIVVADMQGTLVYANPAMRRMLEDDMLVGRSLSTLVSPQDQARIGQVITRMQAEGGARGQIRYQRRDGTDVLSQFSALILRNAGGEAYGLASINRDLSAELQAEQERLALQEQVIEAQQIALKELSTPLMPIADGLVVMPIIGSIDSKRAQQIMDTLLAGIAAQHASSAILDITGVKVVDTQVASAIVQAAHAAQLLGAEVVLTGIGPEVAQTLVHLAGDLHGLTTRSDLRHGIAYALARKR